MFTTYKFEIYQQNIARGRKCVQYYSVRRAVIPFTDCDFSIYRWPVANQIGF